MQLYKLTENYNNLLELLEDENVPNDLIQQSLNDVKDDIENKAENIAKLVRQLDAESKALEDEEKRLANRKKTLKNRSKGLKNYLQASLESVGLKKVKTKLFNITIQKNPTSLNVTDEDSIPDKYFVTEKNLLKTDLLQDLKDGKTIDGVNLKQGESLRIR